MNKLESMMKPLDAYYSKCVADDYSVPTREAGIMIRGAVFLLCVVWTVALLDNYILPEFWFSYWFSPPLSITCLIAMCAAAEYFVLRGRI